ncbi:MAG: T9SS type A sorting domain-containing protein [Ignavibacteriae bacterium]|nr:T9SS type A sorting domain-containing protein [Ignavibacteriota bacterium]
MGKYFLKILPLFLIFAAGINQAQVTLQYVNLNANNINSFFYNTGIYDQDKRTSNTPGFEWPKGSNKFAIFTAGICLAAKINGQLRQAMGSYMGEYGPGYCVDSIPSTNSNFKIYKVSAGDNQNTNPDWANWGLMVPYGAPYVDANHNGIYEPAIDTPGVKYAASTIFICLTDGFEYTHSSGEGFGGGTLPIYAEVHLTAWAYTQTQYADMQFIKYQIINKSKKQWNNTYFSVVSDPDLGNSNDDYIGCDTVRKLGYCYNYSNNDNVYGANPPAVGIVLLKGMYNKSVIPNKDIGMSSFGFFTNTASLGPPCEKDPNGEPGPAYLMMKGFKKDSSNWLDVRKPLGFGHYERTKFCYYGDPEGNTGWTEYFGSVQNCDMGLHDSGIAIGTNPAGDRRFIISSGAENFTVNNGDTQTVYLCQLIARGTTNLNSVTKLKQLSDVAWNLYNNNWIIGISQISSIVPDKYALFQNYPNPFNPVTKIKFKIRNKDFVKLSIFEMLGKEISTLVNERLSAGEYEINFDGSLLSSGIYYYRINAGNYSEVKKMVLLK